MTDPYVEANRALLHERSQTGKAKYGTDLTRADLTTDQWLVHGIEEALDLANYLQRVRDEVKLLRARVAELEADNFALAAGQCLEATADEGGRPYCKRIAELEAQREPAAFVERDDDNLYRLIVTTPQMLAAFDAMPDRFPVYTAPPAPSVPSDAQIDSVIAAIGETVECHSKQWGLPMYGDWLEFYRQQIRAMLAAAPEVKP